jgi:hypothetical protein
VRPTEETERGALAAPPPAVPAPVTRPVAVRARRVAAVEPRSTRGTRDRATLAPPVSVENDQLAVEVTPTSVRFVARGAVAWALAGAAIGAMAILLAGGRLPGGRDDP